MHPHGDSEQRVIVLTYGASDAAEMQLPPSRECLDSSLTWRAEMGNSRRLYSGN